ncbi:MAG: hypothetical protein JO340_03650 [Acidobacteriaceae bacterium]|nr:hypothetical protein [Acidobacteriaceae bacterium]
MTPARGNYFLLNSLFEAQWPIATQTGVYITPDAGEITLDPLPGSARVLDASAVGAVTCPLALAADSQGRFFVLDGANNRLTVLSLATSRAMHIAAFGGKGIGLRQFKSPQSVAVLPSGGIAVADTGNQRVQLFSATPYVLLRVWGPPDLAVQPNAVASDSSGIVYIGDGKSGSVLRVCTSGEWLAPIGAGILTNPVALAVSPDKTLAVIDSKSGKTSLVIFPGTGGKPVHLSTVAAPCSLTFDDTGNLYAGTANAIVAKLQADSTQLSGWSLAGEGVSDVDGRISQIVWVKGSGLIGILSNTVPKTAPRLFSMAPAGAYRLAGTLVLNSLDSRIENCSWHRVRVLGKIPVGASVTVASSTSADNTHWTPSITGALLSGDNPDCLIQSPPGQYLQLTVNLQSNGSVTPCIDALEVHFPRTSYLQYLPAVFQEDDQSRLFLDRFLSIFQTTFDGIDSSLDNLQDVFDPLMTPANVFPWLAAWVALPIDPTMTLDRQRKLLKGAFQAYLKRGTVAGLQQIIQDYTGIDQIRILEHYRVRNWLTLQDSSSPLAQGARLWSAKFYSRLRLGVTSKVGSFRLTNSPPPSAEPFDWGANQFSVFFPASPYTAASTSLAIQKVLDREKPAHTQAFLSPVFPRLRLGVQSTLGVDAYVGKVNPMILGKLSTLNYDAVLARSQSQRDMQALGLSPFPRLGKNATIL